MKTSKPIACKKPCWNLLGLAIVFASFTVVFLKATQSQSTSHPVEKVNWQSNFDQASQLAQQQGKLLFIDFSADYCPGCVGMANQVFSQQTVADQLQAKYVPLRIDVSQPDPQAMKLVNRYQVQGLPSLIVSDAQGNMLAKHEGPLGTTEFVSWINHPTQMP